MLMGNIDLAWLAEMLEQPGYSQAGLAKALGKDSSAVSRILSGEREIKAREVPVILAYLGRAETDQPPEPLALGSAILAARTAKGLTQEELGAAVGVSRQAVNMWETGTNCPTVRRLAAVADALGDPRLANIANPSGAVAGDTRALLAVRAMIEAGASSKVLLAFIDEALGEE